LPLYVAYACEEPSADPGNVSVRSSQIEEAVDECSAMAMKRHNSVGDNLSDNKASDSYGNDDEEELSIGFQKLTAKVMPKS